VIEKILDVLIRAIGLFAFLGAVVWYIRRDQEKGMEERRKWYKKDEEER